MTAVVIEEWIQINRNTLLGFARARMPSGMILHDIGVYYKDGKVWASPAGRPMIGRDGVVMRDGDKVKYLPVISFSSKQARDGWSAAVLAALREAHPEALPEPVAGGVTQ